MKLAQSSFAGFTKFIVDQVLGSANRMANSLANLAYKALYPCHMELNIMAHPSISYATILVAKIQTDCSWISTILSYLRNKILLEGKSEAVKVNAWVAGYSLINDTLYM